jgi:predicted AAA+ superfamily ATPase
MLAHLLRETAGPGRHHVLIDEVQEAPGWEKAIPALMARRQVDVVVTGSNSRLLSSELATHIAGRYVAFEVWPLSFKEHIAFGQARAGGAAATSRDAAFDDYLRRGGFPVTHLGGLDPEQTDRMVYDIYSSILVRDTLTRRQIRNTEMLERVVRFVFDNVGNTFSANAIAKYFKSQRRPVDPETVYSYLDALQEAFLVARVPRYDLRGKEILKTQEKLYVGDHSLINAVLGPSPARVQGILENLVWAELRRRGYRVHVGKSGNQEIDFVADRRGERVYVQVAYLLGGSPATTEREQAPLRAVPDRHRAYVVSLDPVTLGSADGIEHVRIPDFLLREHW